jgi:hypothetical protein
VSASGSGKREVGRGGRVVVARVASPPESPQSGATWGPSKPFHDGLLGIGVRVVTLLEIFSQPMRQHLTLHVGGKRLYDPMRHHNFFSRAYLLHARVDPSCRTIEREI